MKSNFPLPHLAGRQHAVLPGARGRRCAVRLTGGAGGPARAHAGHRARAQNGQEHQLCGVHT